MDYIDTQDMIDLIDLVVKEAGENHISLPQYLTEDNQPRCIAAAVMHRVGVPIKTMQGWGGSAFKNLWSSNRCGAPLSIGATMALDAAQAVQDGQNVDYPGKTWGEARTAAHGAAQKYLHDFDNPRADQKFASV